LGADDNGRFSIQNDDVVAKIKTKGNMVSAVKLELVSFELNENIP
jgi:hypothetical protein